MRFLGSGMATRFVSSIMIHNGEGKKRFGEKTPQGMNNCV